MRRRDFMKLAFGAAVAPTALATTMSARRIRVDSVRFNGTEVALPVETTSNDAHSIAGWHQSLSRGWDFTILFPAVMHDRANRPTTNNQRMI